VPSSTVAPTSHLRANDSDEQANRFWRDVRGESSATLATAKPSRRDCDQTPLLFLVENKIVWVLNFDVEFFQSFVRKITFIECDDDLRSSFNGVGQNMRSLASGSFRESSECLQSLDLRIAP
jgi:hypothetical protein